MGNRTVKSATKKYLYGFLCIYHDNIMVYEVSWNKKVILIVKS